MITQISRVKATSSMEKYLGLPALIGRSNITAFQRLIDRTWKRISSKTSQFLLVARKEIMIKSILQAIPTYTMGIFKLPKSITSRLNVLLKKYWRGYSGEQSKIHWMQ